MGFSKKHQMDGGLESEGGKKWVIAGISIRAPLKSISTKPKERDCENGGEEERSKTPTTRESRIPEKLPCPPAPRKHRPSSACHYNSGREFFAPPDLESVFIRHVEKAN